MAYRTDRPGGGRAFDARDYGARPGSSHDSSAAVQAAVDAAGNAGGGDVRLPGDAQPYYVGLPVFLDRDHVRLVGDGRLATVLKPLNPTQTPLYVWQRGAWSGGTLAPHVDVASHLVPLSGLVAGQSGYGWDLKDDSVVHFVGSVFDQGPTATAGWYGADRVTLAFAVRCGSAAWDVNTTYNLFGMVEFQRWPAPFAVAVSRNKVCLRLQTDDGVKREFRAAVDPDQRVQKIVLQIDLRAPSVVAWANGVRVAVDDALRGEGWSAGLKFQEAWGTPFVVGRAFYGDFDGCDFALLGLKMSCEPVYDGGVSVGAGIARLDAGGVTDPSMFYAGDAATLGLLVPPADTSANGWQVQGYGQLLAGPLSVSNVNPRGLWAKKSHGVPETVTGAGVADLSVDLSGYRSGAALALGPAYDFTADRCNLTGGAFCLASVRAATSYVTRVRDCLLQRGYDHGISLWFGIAEFERTDIKYCGRSPWLFRDASVSYLRGYYAPSSTERRAGTLLGPTTADFVKWGADFEDAGFPSDCGYHVEPAPDVGGVCSVRFTDCGLGQVGGGRPLVRLAAARRNGAALGTTYGAGNVVVDNSFNSFVPAAASCVVEADGPFWSVETRGVTTAAVPLSADARGGGYSVRVGRTVPDPAPPADPGAGFAEATLAGVLHVLDPDALGVGDGLAVPSTSTDAGTVGPTGSGATYHANVSGPNGCVRFDGSGGYALPVPDSPAGGLTVLWATAAAPVNHFDTGDGSAGVYLAGAHPTCRAAEPALGTVVPDGRAVLVHAVRVTDAPGRCLEYWVNDALVERRLLASDAAVAWGAAPTAWAANGSYAPAGDLFHLFVSHAALPDDEFAWLRRKVMSQLNVPI